MTDAVRITADTPFCLTGDIHSGWVLHAGGVPLVKITSQDEAETFLAQVEQEFSEIDEAEHRARQAEAYEEDLHHRVERVFVTGGMP